ncbi:MAG: HEPN domain-containing protein [bacterium]
MKHFQESKDYKDWYERASHDIEDAERLFVGGGYSDTICYLVHQSVEKYLKGFLLFNKANYPFIHDLIKLLRLCSEFDSNIIDYLDECKKINSYYIEDRYPLNAPLQYSKEETKEVIELAKGLIKYIIDN